MGWKEAQYRYKTNQTVTNQNAEDLVARHVLQGLGYTEKDIWELEKRVFGFTDDQSALWPRVQKIISIVFQHSNIVDFSNLIPDNMFVFEGKNKHQDAIKRIDTIFEDHSIDDILLFSRIHNIREAFTYFCKDYTIFTKLKPPFAVLKEYIQNNKRLLLVVQNTTHFISQWRPYTWLEAQKNQ